MGNANNLKGLDGGRCKVRTCDPFGVNEVGFRQAIEISPTKLFVNWACSWFDQDRPVQAGSMNHRALCNHAGYPPRQINALM